MGLPDPAGHAHEIPLQVSQDGVHPGEGGVLGSAPPTRHLVGLVFEPGFVQEVVGPPAICQDRGSLGEPVPEPGLQVPGSQDASAPSFVGAGRRWGFLYQSGRPRRRGSCQRHPDHASQGGAPHRHRRRPPRSGPYNSSSLPLQHYLEDLLFHDPGRLVVDPKLALQFQGRDRVLALGQQVHGLGNLDCERELRALEDGPGCWACLFPADLALEQATRQGTVPRGPALGALETVGPAGVTDGLDALLLGAIPGHELPEGEALLKLDVRTPRGHPTEIIGFGGGHILSHLKNLEDPPTLQPRPTPGLQAEDRR